MNCCILLFIHYHLYCLNLCLIIEEREMAYKFADSYRIQIEIGRNVLTGHWGHSSALSQWLVVCGCMYVCFSDFETHWCIYNRSENGGTSQTMGQYRDQSWLNGVTAESVTTVSVVLFSFPRTDGFTVDRSEVSTVSLRKSFI